MTSLAQYKDKKVAVMGLARSGLSAVRALTESGAHVLAWDDNEEARAGQVTTDLYKEDFKDIASFIWSPGIAHTWPKPHPLAEKARAAGTEIICDVELLGRARKEARFVGITGTNGKSTTTALVGHILRTAGRPVQVGGNIGVPVLDLPYLGEDGTYVLEMSSYQLELIDQLTFDVAVLLNVSPDHLERHGGMEGYTKAKRRIFEGCSTAIIGIDDEHGSALHGILSARENMTVVPVSVETIAEGGVCVLEGELFDAGTPILDLTTIPTLPGRHNWQNAAVAYAAARACGVERSEITAAMATFPGLAHRQELIATIGGVAFINDSKATNADAAEKALSCYDSVYWIAGGRPKEGGIESLRPLFKNIRHAYLIGEAAEAFAATLKGSVPITVSGTLDQAISQAAAAARGQDGAVVLLSPACASWDQFSSFEERGDAFHERVLALAGEVS